MSVYISTERFHAMAETIAALPPCPFVGRVTPDQVKLALAEHGDVWPASIIPDVHPERPQLRLVVGTPVPPAEGKRLAKELRTLTEAAHL
jgi:hypothetical protein